MTKRGPMFVQSTSTLERPYLRLRRALMGDSDWLAPLASVALLQALGLTTTAPIAADHNEALTQLRDTFRCEIGPIRLHVDAITVTARWLSAIEAGLFPAILDADLRLTSLGATDSQLTIEGTYPRPQPPADPDAIHHTVQTAIDTYLRDVTTTLQNQTA